MIRHVISAGAVALLAGSVLSAQEPHPVELGLFGRYTHYSADVGLDDALGAGLRAGYYLSPVLSVEADGSYSTSNEGALEGSHLPVHLRALLNLPFSDRFSFFVGTGPVLDHYAKDLSATNLGLGTTVGARFGITPKLMLRAGGTWDWFRSPRKTALPMPTSDSIWDCPTSPAARPGHRRRVTRTRMACGTPTMPVPALHRHRRWTPGVA